MCVRQITCRDLGILSITFPQDKDRHSILLARRYKWILSGAKSRWRFAQLALHTGAFDGDAQRTDGTGSRGDAEATRALHHTRDERV